MDRAELDALYVAVKGDLMRTARRILADRAAAEDVVQETWVRALRSYRERADGVPSRAWLHRVTVNLCYDRLRSPAVRRETGGLEEAVSHAGPEAELLRTEAAEAVREALAALPPVLRETVLLREAAGLKYREIAQVMGCPAGTVMSRLHLARRRLRAILAPYLEME
jgi:RNA polymerase sigma-70 factor (ECF subfamily)